MGTVARRRKLSLQQKEYFNKGKSNQKQLLAGKPVRATRSVRFSTKPVATVRSTGSEKTQPTHASRPQPSPRPLPKPPHSITPPPLCSCSPPDWTIAAAEALLAPPNTFHPWRLASGAAWPGRAIPVQIDAAPLLFPCTGAGTGPTHRRQYGSSSPPHARCLDLWVSVWIGP